MIYSNKNQLETRHSYSKADTAANEKHRPIRKYLKRYMSVGYTHMRKIKNG